MQPATDQPQPCRRLTVQEAASLLGITVDAVRGRIKRGTLESAKDEDGNVYVLIDDTDQPPNQSKLVGDQLRLVESMQDQIIYLPRQLETEQAASAELRRIVAGLVQRVPELEPAREPRDGPEEAR